MSDPTIHDCPTCHMQPGSDTARDEGCTCPVLDNGRGHNTWLVFDTACPVMHPRREADRG